MRGMLQTRFTPGKFRYNGRVALALIPSLFVVGGFGGKIPVGAALAGAMMSYTLDAMRLKEGALLAVWMTLGVVNLSFWLSGRLFTAARPLLLSILIALCITTTLFTTGVWATLQFAWIQLQYPVVVLAFEKMLLTTAFTVSAMVTAWGFLAALGASHAPFYLAPALCGLYGLLARPLTTSFSVRGLKDSAIGGKASAELQIQAAFDSACAAAASAFLPAALYATVHWNMLGESRHLYSLALLGSVPVLYLSVLEEGLWWLPGSRHSRLGLRLFLGLTSLGLLIAGLEGRVVFPAFGQYIQLHPPWNVIVVTAVLYGASAIALCYASGLFGEDTGSVLIGAALILLGGFGGFAAGMPLLFIVAPVVSAAGLALYLELRQLRDYILFVAGGAATIAWFLHHHFWFLDVKLQGFTLQQLCVLLWVAALLSFAMPGLVISKAPQAVTGLLLLVEAGFLTALEGVLYRGSGEHEGEMYPAAMILMTSALGVAVTHWLQGQRRVARIQAWVTHCIFVAKLTTLILPEGNLPVPSLILALAVTAPVLLPEKASGPDRPPPPWHYPVHLGLIVYSTFYARYAVYDVLMLALDTRPSEGLLLGVLILISIGGSAPLVLCGPTDNRQRAQRRLLVLGAAFGALLVVLRPPLPLQAGAVCPSWLPSMLCIPFWDPAHRPEHETDDISVWGEYASTRDRWPLWMLVLAALAGLVAATSRRPAVGSVSRGLALAVLSGGGIGAYIALEFFPGQAAMQVLVLTATLAAAGYLMCLRASGAASPALICLLIFIWASGLPLGCLFEAAIPLPTLPEDARRVFGSANILIEQQREETNRAALYALYAAEALLLAFATKLRVSGGDSFAGASLPEPGSYAAAAYSLGNAYADQAASFLGSCLPSAGLSNSHRHGRGGASSQTWQDGLSWLPAVGNGLTLASFALSLLLNKYITQGSELAIFILAPMLLLLNQGPLLSGLKPQRRYTPSALAVSGYLSLASIIQPVISLYQEALQAWSTPASVADKSAGSFLVLVKDLWLAGATIPCHLYFAQYLWDRRRTDGATLLLIASLNAPALLFTGLYPVRLLAVSGIVMSGFQYAALRRSRLLGMKLI